MRFAPVLPILLICSLVAGQSNSGGSLFLTARIDATVVVRKHSTGADIVEITVRNPTYSSELLNRQVQRIAQELHEEPRGFTVVRYQFDATDAAAAVLKAKFAVDGLIDRSTGVLRLQPIVRGLCLATATDHLDGLMVEFEAESPTSHTVRSCGPPACTGASFEGRAMGPVVGADGKSMGPAVGIEYRVKLLSHDPASVVLPDGGQPLEPPVIVAPKPRAKIDWLLYGLLGVAAVAVGALVYSLLLRSGSKSRPAAMPKGRPTTRP